MLAQLGSLISHFELLNDTAFSSDTPFFAGICHGGLRAVNQWFSVIVSYRIFVSSSTNSYFSPCPSSKSWSSGRIIKGFQVQVPFQDVTTCSIFWKLRVDLYPLWHVLANEIYHGGLCTFSGKSCSVSSIGHWGSNLNWLSAHHGTCRTSLEVSAPGSLKLSMWTVHGFSPSRLLSDILELMRSRLTAQANLKWYIK